MTRPITIDHSRSDMERRMRLLEMAGGDLTRAMELESWVITAVLIETPPERAMPEETKRPPQAPPPADSRDFDEIVGPVPAHLVRA